MGDERAETYLRLRAEAELRRVSTELRRADAAAADAPPDPQTMPFGISEMAYRKVLRAGRILVAAGVLDQDHLDCIADEMQVPATAEGEPSFHRYRTGPSASFALPCELSLR